MGGGLTFVYDITGSCNCGCEWQGTRPIADRSCIKFDVTKYTIASDVWRQPPSFSILLTHACFLVCHIYLLFLSALLIFPPSADVVFSHRTCLMQRRLSSIKAGNVYEQGVIPLFSSLLQQDVSLGFSGTWTKNEDKNTWIQLMKSILMQTCMKIWRSCSGALSAPATFQVLKKMQTIKREAWEKTWTEWEKTQFWSSLRKCITTGPPIHTSNNSKSPLIHTQQKWKN